MEGRRRKLNFWALLSRVSARASRKTQEPKKIERKCTKSQNLAVIKIGNKKFTSRIKESNLGLTNVNMKDKVVLSITLSFADANRCTNTEKDLFLLLLGYLSLSGSIKSDERLDLLWSLRRSGATIQ
jgi:hypothetical protein